MKREKGKKREKGGRRESRERKEGGEERERERGRNKIITNGIHQATFNNRDLHVHVISPESSMVMQ